MTTGLKPTVKLVSGPHGPRLEDSAGDRVELSSLEADLLELWDGHEPISELGESARASGISVEDAQVAVVLRRLSRLDVLAAMVPDDLPPAPALGAKVPALRGDLTFARVHSAGATRVTDPQNGRCFSLFDFEVSIARLLDGKRSPEAVLSAANRLGITVEPDSLAEFVRQLRILGFLEEARVPVPAPSPPSAPASSQGPPDLLELYQSAIRLAKSDRLGEARGYVEALLQADPQRSDSVALREMIASGATQREREFGGFHKSSSPSTILREGGDPFQLFANDSRPAPAPPSVAPAIPKVGAPPGKPPIPPPKARPPSDPGVPTVALPGGTPPGPRGRTPSVPKIAPVAAAPAPALPSVAPPVAPGPAPSTPPAKPHGDAVVPESRLLQPRVLTTPEVDQPPSPQSTDALEPDPGPLSHPEPAPPAATQQSGSVVTALKRYLADTWKLDSAVRKSDSSVMRPAKPEAPTAPRSKRPFVIALGIVGVALLGAALFRPTEYVVKVPAVITPVALGAPVAGRDGVVKELKLADGAKVEVGDIIAVLDQESLEARAAELTPRLSQVAAALAALPVAAEVAAAAAKGRLTKAEEALQLALKQTPPSPEREASARAELAAAHQAYETMTHAAERSRLESEQQTLTAQLGSIEELRAKSAIIAPASGLYLRPPERARQAATAGAPFGRIIAAEFTVNVDRLPPDARPHLGNAVLVVEERPYPLKSLRAVGDQAEGMVTGVPLGAATGTLHIPAGKKPWLLNQ